MVRRKAVRIGATEVDTADQFVETAQGNHGDAGETARRSHDIPVVAGGEGSQPRTRQIDVLRRQSRHRVDQDQSRNFGDVGREQQVADIVAFLTALSGEFPEQSLPRLPATPGWAFAYDQK